MSKLKYYKFTSTKTNSTQIHRKHSIRFNKTHFSNWFRFKLFLYVLYILFQQILQTMRRDFSQITFYIFRMNCVCFSGALVSWVINFSPKSFSCWKLLFYGLQMWTNYLLYWLCVVLVDCECLMFWFKNNFVSRSSFS